MSPNVFTSLVALLASSHLVSAHMEMQFPAPLKSKYNQYSGQDVDYSMTSPLNADGSNYPCKGYLDVLNQTEGTSTATFSPGQTYNATIVGGAPHAGGSCQFSLSYNKGSSFTTIGTIEGGCPVMTSGNFDFTIPSDAPAGAAVFAWTWFNNEGNREMYMNCASITIGGSAKRRQLGPRDTPFSSLPPIFLANIGNGCTTVASKDVKIPNPGPNTVVNSSDLVPPTGNCQAAVAGSGSGSGSGSSASSAPSASSGPSSSAAVVASSSPPSTPEAATPATTETTAAATASAGSAGGGVFVTVPTDGSSAAPSATPTTLATVATAAGASSASSAADPSGTATAASSPTATAKSSPTASAGSSPTATAATPSGTGSAGSSGSGSGSGGGTYAAGTACTDEGAWNCIGGTAFQRCASGEWSQVIQMAPGTSCTPGVSDTLTYAKRAFGRRGGARRFVNPWII